ncbi:hypothetical protein FJT64_001509 [Amphibalanus amphitrite]|uniref:Ig-like domain-containing protein n=1 Tax=Amphibalanus amphitrite TaxID=1232801 RepID=A0A6A4X669_AMPAM|nr:hypothetical protein FJT64_001509 [Amphibalanus amphitrite]
MMVLKTCKWYQTARLVKARRLVCSMTIPRCTVCREEAATPGTSPVPASWAGVSGASDIVWFKDGRRLPAAASRPALQLTGGNRSVAGMYQCHVTDDLATTQTFLAAAAEISLLPSAAWMASRVVDSVVPAALWALTNSW